MHFNLRYMGNDLQISIPHYINTTLPTDGSQIDLAYTSTMWADLLTAWTDTPVVNQLIFVPGSSAGASPLWGNPATINNDIEQRMNQAWKGYFQIISNGYNDHRINLTSYNYPTQFFVNPVNGRKFKAYFSENTGFIYFKVFDEEDTLLFTSPEMAIATAAMQYHGDCIHWFAFTDFQSFVDAQTAAASRQYIHTLTWNSAYASGTEGIDNCSFHIDQQRETIGDTLWWLFGNEDPEEEDDPDDTDPYSGDPDSPYPPADQDGGDGDDEDPFDEGDNNPLPDDPPVSIADSGLISLYIPSATQLNLLGAYLWSNNFFSSLVKDMYADAMDVIISVGILPFNITPSGTAEIMVGDRGSGVTAAITAERYHTLDCGSVDIKTTIGAYIDYAPYTKGELYLPFVGIVPFDVDAFMKHSISIKYKVDICTGTAVCFLLRGNDVWQTYACNMFTPIPLSAANYSQFWGAVVGATAALAGAGAVGAAGMGAAAGAGEAAEGAQVISQQSGAAAKSAGSIMSGMSTKPEIQKSNNVSVNAGILGSRKPFILLHRPNLVLPDNQNKYVGYPSYIENTLSWFQGYTRVSSINLAVAGATAAEMAMIDSLLKSGVIITKGSGLTGSGIVLGMNSSPAHQIGKQVSTVDTLTGTFRDSVNVINPVVRIEYNDPTSFNYVRVSDFGRNYFVEDIVMVRKNIMDLHLKVDPLDSFRQSILANRAIVDKSETRYNLYLNDDSLKIRQDPLTTTKVFPNGLFDNGSFEYVLITAGH